MTEMTQEYLKSILDYDPDTGVFTRLVKTAVNNNIGDVAGGIDTSTGYYRIKIAGKSYAAHRLVWLWVYGKFPKLDIDHINHIKCDNRVTNLREVGASHNAKNRSKSSNNSTNINGVSWYKPTSRYVAHISVNNKKINLGYFVDFFDACCARKSADNFYNFHINHGK